MKQLRIWQFLFDKLKANQDAVLLYVLDNQGSSPGRKGFKMAIAADGQFEGTIGGGIMEVKLLGLAKSLFSKQHSEVIIKQQFHDKKHPRHQSGMICSGAQTVAIIPLSQKDIPSIAYLIDNKDKSVQICIQKEGFSILKEHVIDQFTYQKENPVFKYIQTIHPAPKVHIFGGGHVGLALSQILFLLEYQVIIYDDRANLNTLEKNHFVQQIQLIDYEKVNQHCHLTARDSVVILTFSYRTDKVILKQLYQKKLAFIGMMGSKAKIENLYQELALEGITRNQLAHIAAPIGLNIYSKTTMEIAISIAGQMILEKNKHLPTGRKQIKNDS